MNIQSIIKIEKKVFFFRSFITILSFLTVTVLSTIVSQETRICFAADRIPGSFSDMIKKANPGVVNVSVVKTTQIEEQFNSPSGTDDPFYEFFKRFYGDQMPRNYTQRGLGTGFIIDKEGYILTNNHVAEGADEITVKLSDNKEFKARVIGLDSRTDLALIKIDGAKDLTPLTLGDSDQIEVGDWVVAIGNPFGLEHTVTAGIVSAKYRQTGVAFYENYIQTDAAINQGNSGGPLMNTDGEVIGINSNIYSQSGGSIGIGFAIPINMAKELLPQLKNGKVVRGWLGVSIQAVTPELQNKLGLKDDRGALVGDVTEGGPAQKAGIQSGDVIVSFDGKAINEMNELPLIVAATPVGNNARVEAIRNGEKKIFDIKVGELKDVEPASSQPRSGVDNYSTGLGFTVANITPEMARQYNLTAKSGVITIAVDNGSPAEEAGLQSGDIVAEIEREKIADTSQFDRKIKVYKKGDTILFLINRQGSSLFLTLKVPQ
jgi:serine protease Do